MPLSQGQMNWIQIKSDKESNESDISDDESDEANNASNLISESLSDSVSDKEILILDGDCLLLDWLAYGARGFQLSQCSSGSTFRCILLYNLVCTVQLINWYLSFKRNTW